jgi:hypothetical protein
MTLGSAQVAGASRAAGTVDAPARAERSVAAAVKMVANENMSVVQMSERRVEHNNPSETG